VRLRVVLILALAALAAAALPGVAGPDTGADRRAVREGAADVRCTGGALPGPVAAFGDRAFVVLTGRDGARRLPVLAGTRFEGGRAAAVGHGAFFNAENLQHPGNARLLLNLVSWLGGRPAARTRLGVVAGDAAALRAAGADATAVPVAELATRLPALDVVMLEQASLDGPAHAGLRQQVVGFVRRGGGLLVAGPAWGWLQLHPGQDLRRDQSGNLLLAPMGLALTDGTVPAEQLERGMVGEDDLLHAGKALDALRRHVEGGRRLAAPELSQAVQSLTLAVGAIPADEPRLSTPVRAFLTKHAPGDVVPTRARPVNAAVPLRRLKLVIENQDLAAAPADAARAHPAAADFPGAVLADAPRVSRVVRVDPSVPAWHSTGLYAAPGEVITVRVEGNAGPARRRLMLRIGSHTDTLWHLDSWERFPEIARRFPLTGPETRIASPFGGAVYVESVGPGRAGGPLQITVSGAVEAPYFVRGRTTPREWEAARAAPGPWAELVGNGIILSIPSAVVRNLRNPQAVMAYWDELSDLACDLYAQPRTRPRPERYCVDRQISAGYMHAGYPIMTGDDVAARFVDLAVLRGKSGDPVWGFYHELGHNFQKDEWTFDGTGEVTCNLLSLYGAEKLNGVLEGALEPVRPEVMRRKTRAHLDAGAPFDKWKEDPFLALIMYVQLRQEFGWEPFTRVFAEYRDLPAAERPKTDDERRDQWLVRMSKAVGRNLGPFFQRWGVPTSMAARRSVGDLPRWLPAELR
jgi:hypothetical protein